MPALRCYAATPGGSDKSVGSKEYLAYTYHTKFTCEASRPKRGSHTESRASLAPRRPLGPIIHHSGGIGVIFDNLQYLDISAHFIDYCHYPLAMPLTSQHVMRAIIINGIALHALAVNHCPLAMPLTIQHVQEGNVYYHHVYAVNQPAQCHAEGSGSNLLSCYAVSQPARARGQWQ